MTRSHDPHIPLSRPDIGRAEVERVLATLQSGRLALGPQIREFERRMTHLTDARNAVAVASGTAALHLILESMGIGDGDEVITTPFSFVATANAALYVDAVPVFADIDAATLNINPAGIERVISPRTRAIVGVDVFGLPADWSELRRIANDHGLRLIDDGCEALGARTDDGPVGSVSDATAFGFYPNKQITTGEGGCITTNDDDLAEVCRSLANQGREAADRMNHVRLGYNYRLSELSGAVGCAQLERFDELQARRKHLAETYGRLLQPVTGDLHLPVASSNRSWFAYVIVLSSAFRTSARDELMERLAARGIESAPYFPCIHLQPLYRERFGYSTGSFPVAESIADRSLALPFYSTMQEEQVQRVAAALTELLPALPQHSRSLAATA